MCGVVLSIDKFLETKKKGIDKEMEKIFPKKITQKWLRESLGKPDYAYDEKTLNKSLAEPIWDFLERGGKRWRPALMLLCCDAVGGDSKKIMPFAALPELVHNGTIMVDDLEDNSEQRRGKPCTHKIYGNDIAVNDANAMYFIPLTLLYKNPLKIEKNRLLKIYDLYSQEMLRVSIGQAMDIWWHKSPSYNISEKQYLQMCVYKTGVLARFSAKLGAILGNGTEKQINALGKFGESLGVGFQIQDDILNIAPSSAKWGKEIGDDISEGKKTLLALHAVKTLPKKDAEKLKKIIDMHTKNKEKVLEAISLIKKSGAAGYASKEAKKIGKCGWNYADKVLKESDSKIKLKEFSDFLVERNY